MNTFERLFKKIPVKYRWYAFVVLAFFSAFCFVHIDSYSADKHHLNGFYWIAGIISATLVGGIFYLAVTEDNK